jgi:MFS family permease
VGAATGGVLFGWMGDRIGRVRAMMLSVLTYAVFSGLCGIATSAPQIFGFRFLSALGMGGEWSLGVALVMEIWPDRSRGLLAGLIGAAANVGFLLIAIVGMGLSSVLADLGTGLSTIGLSADWVSFLTGNSGWRILMLLGATPALLTFFIRIFVPESHRWEREQGKGTTSHWAARDLLGVLIGAAAACGIVYLWVGELNLGVKIIGTAAALIVASLGYLYPVIQYLGRVKAQQGAGGAAWGPVVGRMLLGACLSGVPLLGTWGSLQWAPLWADKLCENEAGFQDLAKEVQTSKKALARSNTQIWSAIGAIVGTMVAAVVGHLFGRRITYFMLCLGSLLSALAFFQLNEVYGIQFLVMVFFAGGMTASFYGWLPLYLPELFGTSVRAMGQGFAFNFGRILAAIGVLQTGYLMKEVFQENYPQACSVLSLIYLVGLVIIWFAPETKGQPLPD